MNKFQLIGLSVLLFATSALAGDVFEHPQTLAEAQSLLHAAMPDLNQVQVLRGRYQQRKFLDEIPKPLASSGEFLLVRERGIWWHTQTPLDAELVLTPDALAQPASGAAKQSRRTSRGDGTAVSLFFALFALDLDTLARNFDLFAMAANAPTHGSQWQLGLRPRDAALAAWVKQVTISGGSRVEQLTLVEAAGDRTEIDLDASTHPLTSLTDTEHLRFEP